MNYFTCLATPYLHVVTVGKNEEGASPFGQNVGALVCTAGALPSSNRLLPAWPPECVSGVSPTFALFWRRRLCCKN